MKILKLLIAVVLSFSTAFIGIGYAQLNSAINLETTVTGTMPTGIFISDVSETQGITINTYYSTILNSEVILDSTDDEKTLTITLYNNSAGNYVFDDVEYDADIFDGYTNNHIEFTHTLKKSQKIEAKTELKFTITFAFINGYTTTQTESLRSILNFRWIDEDKEVNIAVSENFKEILNDSTKHNELTSAMDNNYDGKQAWTATYIGNVAGSSDDDSELLQKLFGGLSLDISGNNVQVTCIIKRENIDGNDNTGDTYSIDNGTNTTYYRGCEMTLYLTTINFDDVSYNDYITVYAMVFTKYSDSSEWTQIGEKIYEGTAQVVGYVGGATTGSFDTGTWRSSKQYHEIESGAKISKLITAAINRN